MAKPTYESLVKQGRQVVTQSQWTLGDLATTVEIAYGQGKIQEYADDIGVTYSALREYRRVSAAYESAMRLTDVHWSVYAILAAQQDRVALLEPGLTASAARAIVRARSSQTDIVRVMRLKRLSTNITEEDHAALVKHCQDVRHVRIEQWVREAVQMHALREQVHGWL